MDPGAQDTSNSASKTPRRRRRHADGDQANIGQPNHRPKPQTGETADGSVNHRQPRRHRATPASSNDVSTSSAGPSGNSGVPSANQQGRRRPRNPTGAAETGTNSSDKQPPRSNGRRANFGAGLTTTDDSRPPANRGKQTNKPKDLPQGDDLTSTLIRGLSTPPYPDCPICFSSIRPDHAIWSCSPSIPIVVSSEAQVKEYCWTSFHVKCIRSWAEKSVKDVAEAWRARGETDKKGDWRCPGCQAKREIVPSGYWYVVFTFQDFVYLLLLQVFLSLYI